MKLRVLFLFVSLIVLLFLMGCIGNGNGVPPNGDSNCVVCNSDVDCENSDLACIALEGFKLKCVSGCCECVNVFYCETLNDCSGFVCDDGFVLNCLNGLCNCVRGGERNPKIPSIPL